VAAVATLAMAPGDGLLARRPTALLFVPQRDAVLVEAFRVSEPGEELHAIATTVVGAGFEVGPFACVSWAGDVRVMVFGDVAIETDQPSLPMLSGAGSRTWVEHTLALSGAASLAVAGDGADADTDLAAGVGLAGGFRLDLVPASAARHPEPPAAPAVAVAQPADPTTAVPRVPAVQEPVDVHDPDVTLPPPAADELLGTIGHEQPALVEAKVCGRGHVNPPTSAICAVCGAPLRPGSDGNVHVTRPSLGRLQFDDGDSVELDHDLLIGRNPDRDTEPSRAELRRVKAIGDKVSRSHLEVRLQGWDILVVDCGSTNGTFVVPHAGGQVVAVDPGRPQLVEPGAAVYFGSRSFTVLGRAE
jgi:hypothetical protein